MKNIKQMSKASLRTALALADVNSHGQLTEEYQAILYARVAEIRAELATRA